MLAHELRNPLGVIVNAIALIDGLAELPFEPRRASAMIRRQADHLTRLLDDLLDVARITGERIELERAPVDFGAAVALAVEAQRHHLDRRRQRLSVELPAAALTVAGDAMRLQAATGREGIEIAARDQPDVVLVDIGLPDIDGYTVGRELRQRFGSGLHLLALTGYGQPQDRANSLAAGFDAHLVKPIEPAKLAEVLRLHGAG
jgi:CheY-like chemotaxis protein